MKKLYFLLLGLTMVFLAACSSPTGVETGVETEPVVIESSFDYSGSRHSAPDLSSVANTGRVQFLNSYADW